MFFRQSILDKVTVLDKTCLVVQSVKMLDRHDIDRNAWYKNCLIGTELTLSATTANKSRYKWIPGLEEIIQYAQEHSSATVMKKLSVSKLHNFTLSLPLCEVSISTVL